MTDGVFSLSSESRCLSFTALPLPPTLPLTPSSTAHQSPFPAHIPQTHTFSFFWSLTSPEERGEASELALLS